MRGEAEQKCFNIVKKKINDSVFFGTSYEDEMMVREAFKNAIPNPHASEFPDFIFNDGFIEHFKVTSSPTSKKRCFDGA